MPIFEYTCENCGNRFEKLVLSASRERQVRCPQCNSQEVKKAISLFGTASGGPSGASAASCAPSG